MTATATDDDDAGTTPPSLGSSDDDSSTGAKLLPPTCSTFISPVVSIATATEELSAVVVVG